MCENSRTGESTRKYWQGVGRGRSGMNMIKQAQGVGGGRMQRKGISAN